MKHDDAVVILARDGFGDGDRELCPVALVELRTIKVLDLHQLNVCLFAKRGDNLQDFLYVFGGFQNTSCEVGNHSNRPAATDDQYS